jgi:hypothetical protein
MKSYVAYHSASVMGRPYEHEPGSPFVFSSSKSEGFLRSMLGHPTWVIASEKQGPMTRYSLAGVFTPLELDGSGDIWDVTGPGTALSPFRDVTAEPWLALLLKEQANFSLGLNVIKSEEVVAALTRALSLDDRAPSLLDESPDSFEEGKSVRIVVNRYERDRAARAACLEAHGRVCVVCRVDLASVYGPIAAGVIHVHHRRPLAEIGESYAVDPVRDLVPVCPNCHAVIHAGGLIAPEDLARVLKQTAAERS